MTAKRCDLHFLPPRAVAMWEHPLTIATGKLGVGCLLLGAALVVVGCQAGGNDGGGAPANTGGSASGGAPGASGSNTIEDDTGGSPPLEGDTGGSNANAAGAPQPTGGTAGSGASMEVDSGGTAGDSTAPSPGGGAGAPPVTSSGAAGLAGTAGAPQGAGGSSVPACGNTTPSSLDGYGQPGGPCRWQGDCGDSLIKCCGGGGSCWPASACPIPPTMCGTMGGAGSECSADADCPPDGTCVTTVEGCPQCPVSRCEYPPPLCTDEPTICGDIGRCQPDGTCAPVLCDEGFECSPDRQRCNVGSPRADEHGCEYLPCDDGWDCEENTRCTPPTEPGTHGCTVLECGADSDCDCGYCVNGHCTSLLGTCVPAPA